MSPSRLRQRIVAVEPFRGRRNVGPTNAAVPAAAKRAELPCLVHKKLLLPSRQHEWSTGGIARRPTWDCQLRHFPHP